MAPAVPRENSSVLSIVLSERDAGRRGEDQGVADRRTSSRQLQHRQWHHRLQLSTLATHDRSTRFSHFALFLFYIKLVNLSSLLNCFDWRYSFVTFFYIYYFIFYHSSSFLRFFQNPKKRDFLRFFEVSCQKNVKNIESLIQVSCTQIRLPVSDDYKIEYFPKCRILGAL